MCDFKLPDTSTHFKVGQAVVAMVTDVDLDKRRFLLSLRMSQCGGVAWAMDGHQLLRDYLTEAEFIVDRLKSRGTYFRLFLAFRRRLHGREFTFCNRFHYLVWWVRVMDSFGVRVSW